MTSNPAKRPADVSDEPDVAIDADFLNELNLALAEKERVALDFSDWDKPPSGFSLDPLSESPLPPFPDTPPTRPDFDEEPPLPPRKPPPWESSAALVPHDKAASALPSRSISRDAQPTRAARVADTYRTVREEPETEPETPPPVVSEEPAPSPDFHQLFARHSEQMRVATSPQTESPATAAAVEKMPSETPEKAAEKPVTKPVDKRAAETKAAIKPREESFLASAVQPPAAAATTGVSPIMTLVLSVAGVLAGAAGLWSSAGWQDAVSSLEARFERLPAVAAAAPAPEMTLRWANLERQINSLTAELAALKSSQSPTRPGSRDQAVLFNADLEPLLARLNRLENTLAALEPHPAPEPRKPAREVKPRKVAVDVPPPQARHEPPPPAATPAPVIPVSATPVPAPAPTPPTPAAATSRVTNGAWVVNLFSVESAADAEREQRHLSSKGIETEVEKVNLRGKNWFRIRAMGFADSNSARRYADELKHKQGVKGPWVGRR
ncbi:MAG: SPOR domain-containing protein [Pseudomonadota bacterium]